MAEQGFNFWGELGVAVLSGLADWLMSDRDDEEKRREVEIMLDRERRRMPPWAYNKIKGMLSATPSPHGGGAFQRAVSGGGGQGMVGAGGVGGGGMVSRVPPQRMNFAPRRDEGLGGLFNR